MDKLTKKQQKIYNFIKSFVKKSGYPPSHEDIRARMGFSSSNAVSCHLQALEKKGYISITPYVSRGIRVLK